MCNVLPALRKSIVWVLKVKIQNVFALLKNVVSFKKCEICVEYISK